MEERSDTLLRGTLDVLVLRSLAGGQRHGYAIARWIEETSGQILRIEEGSLYPALYRMDKRGWIEAEWNLSELNRKAKFYRLTPEGRLRLARETERWLSFSTAITQVLKPA